MPPVISPAHRGCDVNGGRDFRKDVHGRVGKPVAAVTARWHRRGGGGCISVGVSGIRRPRDQAEQRCPKVTIRTFFIRISLICRLSPVHHRGGRVMVKERLFLAFLRARKSSSG